jgi:hypothetical protein
MNAKIPILFRALIGVGLLIFFVGGLSIRSVQSADPSSINADATLKLVKTVTNNDHDTGGGLPDDWTLSATAAVPNDDRNFSNAGGSGDFTSVYADVEYTLSESSLLWTDGVEYNAGTWSCDGGTLVGSVITLGAAEAVTCTIDNDDIAPLLTIIKNPTNDNGFTALPDDFDLTVGGSSVSSGVQNPYLANTAYVINETLIANYRFVSITGDPKCPASLGGSITMAPGDVITCIITNNDIGVKVIQEPGLQTSEDGSPVATFDVVLGAKPNGNNTTIGLTSSDPTEGEIDKTSLVFTELDWNIPQTVTITGVDDFVADGNIPYTIITDSISSNDSEYNALDPSADIADVDVTNADNDTAGISVSPNTNLWTSEGGEVEKISVLLQSRPTTPILLTITSSPLGEGTISPSSFTINPDPWPPPSPKNFTVTGIDDCKIGDDSYEVTITATSLNTPPAPKDENYDGMKVVLNFTNYDAPTIEWIKPVGNEQYFDSNGIDDIHLEVKSLCPEPIARVSFYRWVVSIGDNLEIGEDHLPPYDEELIPSELEEGVNQVRAYAIGPANGVQTRSQHVRILINSGNLVYLPISINKPQ